MPSLLGTTVAANYGRMVPQQTYGVGENQTNFGTRQLVLIKVLTSGTAADMRYQDGATSSLSYDLSNSCYSVAIRALQAFAEVYAVYTPVATGFIALIAYDTQNGADSGNTQAATYGLMEAAIAAAIDSAKASATKDSTCTISLPTVAIGTTL
jgi:hypothetical protein